MEFIRLIQKASFFAVFMAMLLVAILVIPATAGMQKNKQMVVAVSSAVLKEQPKPFGSKIIQRLKKGDEVKYLAKEGIYYKVIFGKKEGFLAAKSLIDPKKFGKKTRGGKVSQSDMAAVTKGFSPEVEKERRKNKKLRYDLMDKAEKNSTIKDPMASFSKFREKGKLGEFAEVTK